MLTWTAVACSADAVEPCLPATELRVTCHRNIPQTRRLTAGVSSNTCTLVTRGITLAARKKAPKFQGRLKCSTFNTDDATQHRAPMPSAGIQVCARQCRRVLNLQAAPHTKQDTPPCNRPKCLRARRSQPTVDVVGWHSRPLISIAHASPDLRSDLTCYGCEWGGFLHAVGCDPSGASRASRYAISRDRCLGPCLGDTHPLSCNSHVSVIRNTRAYGPDQDTRGVYAVVVAM